MNVGVLFQNSAQQEPPEVPAAGVGAWLRVPPHNGGDRPRPGVLTEKYPKRSQYKYTKSRYRVRNWAEYEAGLQKRGDLTV